MINLKAIIKVEGFKDSTTKLTSDVNVGDVLVISTYDLASMKSGRSCSVDFELINITNGNRRFIQAAILRRYLNQLKYSQLEYQPSDELVFVKYSKKHKKLSAILFGEDSVSENITESIESMNHVGFDPLFGFREFIAYETPETLLMIVPGKAYWDVEDMLGK